MVISPYVVLIDNKTKAGTFIISNKTEQTQEVSIFFKFGYPVTDANGNITMNYDSSGSNQFDLTSMVNAFPKKFSLKPGAKQTIRMTVKPNAGIPEGTLWTRIITSSQSKQTLSDTSTTLSAAIDFILNQVTTVLYKNTRYENTINLGDISVTADAENLNVFTQLEVKGDNPFFSGTVIKIYDSSNNLIKENKEYFTVYYGFNKRTSFPITEFKPGKYTGEVTIIPDDNADIPKSDKPLTTPITKKFDFTVE
jgi:hypothetical protein